MSRVVHIRRPLPQRFPQPAAPNGWFGVLRSEELRARRPVPLRYFGRELVAFRDAGGAPVVLDAHCPHLGAHLGVGGAVVDGELRCPFHHWCFDGRGRCTAAPGARRPPRVSLRRWPSDEVNGVVFVWHHAGGAAPSWRVPEMPERRERGWSRFVEHRRELAAHVQEMRENIGDESHFAVIHGQAETGPLHFAADGHRATIALGLESTLLGRRLRYQAEVEMLGPGVLYLRARGATRFCVMALTTPIDDAVSEMRLLVTARGPALLGLAQALGVRQIAARDLDLEGPIWEHKRYVARPPYLPHERTQRRIREWYSQFY
jgi:nitrite reductase/ring-hydroxylating ferredoxin subunit